MKIILFWGSFSSPGKFKCENCIDHPSECSLHTSNYQFQTIQVQMYKKYVEKRSADDILSEEGLLSKDVVPQQPLHKCLSLKKILLAHLLILALYTFLFLYAWRITAGGSCSLIQRGGNEVYCKSTVANVSHQAHRINSSSGKSDRS